MAASPDRPSPARSTPRRRRTKTPHQVIVGVGLKPAVIARLDADAASRGLSRARWIAALVSWRLLRRARFRRPDELAILAAQADLRRLVVRVDTVLRAWPPPPDEDAAARQALATWREEVRASLVALQAAVLGDLSYWSAR